MNRKQHQISRSPVHISAISLVGTISTMYYLRIITIVVALGVIGCNSRKDHSAAPTGTIQQYAYVTNIIEHSDSTFLDTDYIQYLTGDSAAAAAAKMGDLDSSQTEDGITHADVSNDYYIINENKRVRRIPVAINCRYDLLISIDRINKITENSLVSLKKIYHDSPFLLTIANGEVVEVKEIFIP